MGGSFLRYTLEVLLQLSCIVYLYTSFRSSITNEYPEVHVGVLEKSGIGQIKLGSGIAEGLVLSLWLTSVSLQMVLTTDKGNLFFLNDCPQDC